MRPQATRAQIIGNSWALFSSLLRALSYLQSWSKSVGDQFSLAMKTAALADLEDLVNMV